MATAVKLETEAKSKLEELQAEITLKTETKVTQQQILTRLISSAATSTPEFIDSFREGTTAYSDEELTEFFSVTFDSGIETDEEDIDEVLYG